MKIAFVTPLFPTREVPHFGVFNYQTVRALQSLADVHVYCPLTVYPRLRFLRPRYRTYHPTAEEHSPAGVVVDYVGYPTLPIVGRPFNAGVCAHYLRPYVEKARPDVILAPWLYPEGFSAVLTGERLGVPVITGALGSDLRCIAGPIVRQQVAQTLKRSHFVFTVSEELRQRAIKLRADPSRVITVINGCDSSVFCPGSRADARAALGVDLDEKTVLFVGRLVRKKGVLDLLAAFATLAGQDHQLRLVFAGEGPLDDELRQQASVKGLGDRVRLLGGRRMSEVANWMRASSVVCLPSYSEGCPNVVLEALSCGRPVVTCPVGGIPEISSSACAILVPPGDVVALSQGLLEALNRNWDENAIARQFTRSWDDVARELMELCERALREGVRAKAIREGGAVRPAPRTGVSTGAKGVRRLAHAARQMARPSHFLALMQSFQRPESAGQASLADVMAWLCRAQDHGGSEGVSWGYSLIHNWRAPYPETTGYIIPTFFDYALLTGSDEYRERARRMTDWEVRVQMPSGAVQAGVYEPERARVPAVFNTGQVILGWCRAFRETANVRYLEAAVRAGDWLLQCQSPDGAWRLGSQETGTDVHAYDARTAWSLLELDLLVGGKAYRQAAELNLTWTLGQQRENAWFDNNAFFPAGHRLWRAFTHTIAYVLEGLCEAWRIIGDQRYLSSATVAAERLLRIYEQRGWMPGDFDPDWNSSAHYACLTGNAQIAGVWLRLFKVSGDSRYAEAAHRLLTSVQGTIDVETANPGIRGGVKGSLPITGRYLPFAYLNWAAKFLADSLMLEQSLTRVGQTVAAGR